MNTNQNLVTRSALVNLLSDYMPDTCLHGPAVWSSDWRGRFVRVEFDYLAPSYTIRFAYANTVTSAIGVHDAVSQLDNERAAAVLAALADHLASLEKLADAIVGDLEYALDGSDCPTEATIRAGDLFVLYQGGAYSLGYITGSDSYVMTGKMGLTASDVARLIVRMGRAAAWQEGYDGWLERMNGAHDHVRAFKSVIMDAEMQLREVSAERQPEVRAKLANLRVSLDHLRNYYATADVPTHTIKRATF